MGISFKEGQEVKVIARNSDFNLLQPEMFGPGDIGIIRKVFPIGDLLKIRFLYSRNEYIIHAGTVIPMTKTPLEVEVREIILEYKKLGYTYQQIEAIILDVFKRGGKK